MNAGAQYLRDQALEAAAYRLRKAAVYAGMSIKNPIFQKRLGKGAESVFVRFEWPGVLTVIDPESGEVLATSEAGRPDVLLTNFIPPIPALANCTDSSSSEGR